MSRMIGILEGQVKAVIAGVPEGVITGCRNPGCVLDYPAERLMNDTHDDTSSPKGPPGSQGHHGPPSPDPGAPYPHPVGPYHGGPHPGGPSVPYNPYGPPTGGGGGSPGSPYNDLPPPAPPFPGIGWFVLLVVIGFGVQLAIWTIGIVLVVVISQTDVGIGSKKLLEVLPLEGIMGIVLAASLTWPIVALVAARLKRVLTRDTFRLRSPGWSTAALSLVLGAALVPLALAMEHVTAQFLPRGQQIIVTLMAGGPSPLALALLGMTLVIAAPVGEELLFRGLAMRGIERRSGFFNAAFVVSLVFTTVHMNVTGFLSLFMVSLVLCWVTRTSGSLVAAILLHAAYNGLQFLMILGTDFSEKAQKKATEAGFGIPIWFLVASLALAVLCLYLIRRNARGRVRAAS